MKKGYRIAQYSCLLQLSFAFFACLSFYFAIENLVDFIYAFVELFFFMDQYVEIIFFACSIPFLFFVVPIKFFISKEYMLIFLDEYKNNRITGKANMLKTSFIGEYSDNALMEVKPNYFLVLR